MNILVYKGEFAYDVVNLFMYNTVYYLEKKGNNIILIDTTESNAKTMLIEAFQTRIMDLVISFGIVNNPKLDDGSYLYNVVNTTVLAIYVDYPAYYINSLTENIKNFLCCFNDLDEDINNLKELLINDKKLFEMSQNAYKIAKKYHTWENRVDTILDMVKLSKLMDI